MSILEQQYEALFTPWKVGNVEIKTESSCAYGRHFTVWLV